jgi:hypothetical protein
MNARWMGGWVWVLGVVVWTSPGQAQVPRYVSPAGGPLPSQLNYFRFDGLTPLLGNYNGIVAPMQNYDYQLQQMRQEQHLAMRSVEREFAQIRQSQAAPTGVGATFMNYSHYYGGLRGSGAGSGGRRAPAMRSGFGR